MNDKTRLRYIVLDPAYNKAVNNVESHGKNQTKGKPNKEELTVTNLEQTVRFQKSDSILRKRELYFA